MTPLFTLGDILRTPQGIVLAGSINSQLDFNPSSIGFYDQSNRFFSWTVENIQFTVSASDKINLFLLLGNIDFPSTFKPGVTIYAEPLKTETVLAANTTFNA